MFLGSGPGRPSSTNDEVLATALLDRPLHHAEVISINGKSYRMKDHPAADKNKAASRG